MPEAGLSSSQNNSMFSSPNTGRVTSPTVETSWPFIEEPQASKVFRIVFFSLTTVASLVGNSIMLKAAYGFRSRKPLSYHLVTNLAAAEIINTMCLPFIFVYMYLDYVWPFGEFACKVTTPFHVLSLFVVTYTLAAISVYRFVFIVFQVRITVSYCQLILFLSLLWLAALAVSMPLFVHYKLIIEHGYACVSYDDFEGYHKYQPARFILNYGMPYLIMVVSYGAVALKLKRHISRNKGQIAEMSELGENTKETAQEKEEEAESDQQQDTEARPYRQRRKNTRAITDLEQDLLKMIYAIIIVFAVCYLPLQVEFMFSIFKGYYRYPETKKYQLVIRQYCWLLASLSSALHPLCYGTISKFYARSFSRFVLCRCKSSQ